MNQNSPNHASKVRLRFWAAVLLLTLIALAMRLYQLDTVPRGLFYDEAYEGLDAMSLRGQPFWQWSLFFTAINGREPLFVYLVHLAQSIWGPTILSVRVVAATAGALLTPALIWLAWTLAPWLHLANHRRFALWAGLASLALLWPQTIARLGQRISLFALLEVLALAALWWAMRRTEDDGRTTEDDGRTTGDDGRTTVDGGRTTVDGRNRPVPSPQSPITNHHSPFPWLLAGILLGLSFYTYLAVRLLPLVLIPVGVALLLQQRPLLWKLRWRIGLAALAALVTAMPLLVHFANFPQHFSMRTGQVSVLAQGWPTLWTNVQAVLGMAFGRGDFNFRLNYPDRPVFDLLTVLPFVLGLLVALRHFWRPAQVFLLSGLAVMLLPTLLSEEAPNFGRSFGAFPFAVLLLALGVERTIVWISQRRPGLVRWAGVAGCLLLTASTAWTLRVYFVDWANHADAFAAWDTGYTAVAAAVLADVQDSGIDVFYAGPGVAENPSVEYLLADLDPAAYPRRFDGNLCLRVDSARAAHYYVLPSLTPRGAALLKSYLPDSQTTTAVVDAQGNPWAERIAQPPGGRVDFAEMTAYPTPLSDGIGLRGYWLSQQTLQPGSTFYIRLFWDVNAPPSQNYTAFVQLLHQDANGNWQQLAGADRPPGGGACPTNEWTIGEVVIDELQFTVPAELPEGDLVLAAGFYDDNGVRLNVPGNGDGVVLIALR